MLNNLRHVLSFRKEDSCDNCARFKEELRVAKEENARLRAELERISGKVANSIPIGDHTPSGQIPFQIPFKEQSKEKDRRAKGGARIGHKGAGLSRPSRSLHVTEE